MLYLQYTLLIVMLAAAVAGAVLLCRRAVKAGVFAPDAERRVLAAEILRAAGAALGLFFLVESGIERYIGFSLFTPVRDGQPMVVRALVLFLCTSLSFGTAMTANGRALCRKFTAACRKDWARWLMALAVTGLFFAWTLRVTVLSYMTNDDISLINSIVRVSREGLSSAGGAFSNVLFCGLLSLFYKIDPSGLWYFGYHLFVLLGSAVIIGRCILTKTSRRGLSALTGCLIHLLLCVGVFLYSLAQLSFTVTPAVAGSAAVALVLCRDELQTRPGRVVSDIGCVILMLLCWLHRQSAGQCLLCFWALAMAYAALKLILSRAAHWKRQIIALGLSAVALPLLCFGASSFSSSVKSGVSSDDGSYWTAEYYRSMVMDYMAEDLTDEQWESVGIPRELGTLVRDWYFMDERINTDTFKSLTELYYDGTSADTGDATSWKHLVGEATAAQTKGSLALMGLYAACAVLLFFLSVMGLAIYGRRNWPELLCSLGALGGGILLCLYLIREGRFPVRVFLVVAIPAIITLLLMALTLPASDGIPAGRRPVPAALSGIFAAGLTVCCWGIAALTPYATEYATHDTVFAEQTAVEDYVNANPDIYYVTNLSVHNLDPLHGPAYPSNMGLWGGTGVTAQTEGRLYAGDFFRDDIQLIYTPASTVIAVLQYLTLDNGPVQAELMTQLSPSVFVCGFTRITPGENYTGWYEQNGMTYYFENGRAVTGTKTIDGVEYEFAPAGAEAKLAAAVDGETGHTMYATNAYSLITGG